MVSLFYIEEKRSHKGKWVRTSQPYRTRTEAEAMMVELNEHGGCGPLRIVEVKIR